MRFTKAITFAAIALILGFSLAACEDDAEETPAEETAFEITQAQLDAATIPLTDGLDITGDPFNAFPADDTATRENKIRDLFSDVAPDAAIEVGNVWQRTDDISFSNTLTAGSVFIIFDTLLGPLYLAYGAAEGGRSSGYLFLGQTF